MAAFRYARSGQDVEERPEKVQEAAGEQSRTEFVEEQEILKTKIGMVG